jgi:hypothetical protein
MTQAALLAQIGALPSLADLPQLVAQLNAALTPHNACAELHQATDTNRHGTVTVYRLEFFAPPKSNLFFVLSANHPIFDFQDHVLNLLVFTSSHDLTLVKHVLADVVRKNPRYFAA